MNKENCSYPDRLFDWLDKWIEAAPQNFLDLDRQEVKMLSELASCWKTSDQVALLKAMEAQYGDRFVELIEMIMKKKMLTVWQNESKEYDSHTCRDMVKALWEPMQELGFEYTATETNEGIQMRITRCPYADVIESDDDRKWLYHLFCSGDPQIVEGFNPDMGFKRSKTLVEGDECCDHFYYMKS